MGQFFDDPRYWIAAVVLLLTLAGLALDVTGVWKPVRYEDAIDADEMPVVVVESP